MGEKYAQRARKKSQAQHKWVTENTYKAEHFSRVGNLPEAGTWMKLEIPAEELGLVGRKVDGFFYASKNGRALWDHTVLVRNGQEIQLYSDDAMGIPPEQLQDVTVSVPDLPDGTEVRVLFEERSLTVQDGQFTDNFEGLLAYGRAWGGLEGDNFCFMPGRSQHDFRELLSIMPSGYGYDYNEGKAAVHIYEIPLE
jgi:hypothetical protein